MTTFEQAFSDTERAADSALKSAGVVNRHARALMRAAKAGNIAAVKRAQSDLDEAMKALRQEVDNANSVWPFHADEEERYLQDGYADELIAAAQDAGLSVYKEDDALISYPSIVHIRAGERAVRIDDKKESGIRPSHLAKTLIENQKKTGRFRPNQILESMYAIYSEIAGEYESGGELIGDGGRVVPLARIYNMMVVSPIVKRGEYRRTEFAFNLYAIETQGPRVTKRGYRVDFPSSTGTRQRRASDLFHCISPDGQRITYYGVRFSEDAR